MYGQTTRQQEQTGGGKPRTLSLPAKGGDGRRREQLHAYFRVDSDGARTLASPETVGCIQYSSWHQPVNNSSSPNIAICPVASCLPTMMDRHWSQSTVLTPIALFVLLDPSNLGDGFNKLALGP